MVSNIRLYRYFYTHPATAMRNITHATLKPSSSHTIFPHQLIAMPSFCYSHVCVCFHIMPYANCLGWTVLYVHVKYGIYINMYDASTQGVDERMINVHYLKTFLV